MDDTTLIAHIHALLDYTVIILSNYDHPAARRVLNAVTDMLIA